MNIEALKQQLAEGKISKEQFLAELKKLLDAGTITQEEHDAAAQTEPGGSNPDDKGGKPGGEGLTLEQVQQMIQSETDKVRTKYAQTVKDLELQLDKLKTEKMTDEQKAEHERKKFEDQLKQREKDLLEREVKLHTVDKLRELELPLEFRDVLAGADVEATDANITSFADQWQKALKAAVDKKFKEHGDDPNKKKGKGGSDVKNPWSDEHFNLTKQAEIMKNDPELAKQLKAQAGK